MRTKRSWRISLFSLGSVFLLAATERLSADEFLKGALRYDPPPMLFEAGLHSGPGVDHFSGDGPGTQFLTDNGHYPDFGSIKFQFGLVGFSVGNGFRITYVAVDTNYLRRLFEQTLTKSFGQAPVISWTNVGRLPAITARHLRKTEQAHLTQVTWVHIETNIVLKIEVLARSQKVFNALAESLKTVSVDTQKYFESLRPKPPKITTMPVFKVEIGFVRSHYHDVPGFVLRSKAGVWSLISGSHFDQDSEKRILNSLQKVLEKLSQQSAGGTLCRTTVDVTRFGPSASEVQRTVAFHGRPRFF